MYSDCLRIDTSFASRSKGARFQPLLRPRVAALVRPAPKKRASCGPATRLRPQAQDLLHRFNACHAGHGPALYSDFASSKFPDAGETLPGRAPGDRQARSIKSCDADNTVTGRAPATPQGAEGRPKIKNIPVPAMTGKATCLGPARECWLLPKMKKIKPHRPMNETPLSFGDGADGAEVAEEHNQSLP